MKIVKIETVTDERDSVDRRSFIDRYADSVYLCERVERVERVNKDKETGFDGTKESGIPERCSSERRAPQRGELRRSGPDTDPPPLRLDTRVRIGVG